MRRLTLTSLILLGLAACGDEEQTRPRMVLDVAQGSCNPGCSETSYTFMVVREELLGDCYVARVKTGAGSGSRQAVLEGVPASAGEKYYFAVLVTCPKSSNPSCARCEAWTEHTVDTLDRPKLTLEQVHACVQIKVDTDIKACQ